MHISPCGAHPVIIKPINWTFTQSAINLENLCVAVALLNHACKVFFPLSLSCVFRSTLLSLVCSEVMAISAVSVQGDLFCQTACVCARHFRHHSLPHSHLLSPYVILSREVFLSESQHQPITASGYFKHDS